MVTISAIPGLTFPANKHASSLYCPWAFSMRVSVGAGAHFHLCCEFRTRPSLVVLHPAVMGVLCAQGQHLPGHFLSAAWLQLPVCGGIQCLRLMSPLLGPTLRPRVSASPALVSKMFHLARGAVLCPRSVCHHCWALFRFSSATWVEVS